MKLATFLISFLFFSLSFAQEVEKSNQAIAPAAAEGSFQVEKSGSTYLMCKSGTSVRTLRMQSKGKSCVAIYTKEGVDQVVGRATKDSVCFEALSKIQKVLEAAKWTCRDISEARVSSSLD